MVAALRERLSESFGAFRSVFANPDLRRVELAAIGSETGKWFYLIALAVYAYDDGGAAAVGVVSLIRMLPAAVGAPFTALLGDRYRRQRVMVVATLVRVVAMTIAVAVIVSDGPAALVYALAAVVTLSGTAFRPAQAALMPSLARTPEELTAANVASSTIASVGSFAGPALGGILLAGTDVETVFATTAAIFLVSTAIVSRIRPEAAAARARPAARPTIATEALAGFRTILADRGLTVLVSLYGAQTFVAGALNVLIVVAALELLDLGDAGVGWLNSAFGVGALVGAVLALALVSRQRLASDFTSGIVLWGLPLIVIGLWPEPAAAIVLLALVGVGDTLVEVAAPTLLQRSVADDVLARVFGALESLLIGTMALGAIIAPLLVEGLGARAALVATGAVLPVLGLLTWRRMRALDAARIPRREIDLLRGAPIFSPLPAATLEQLASRLVPVDVAAGSEVFRQGDPGERFYLVSEGQVDVAVDGRAENTLGPGDFFGEIALLRDLPRTGTVRATQDTKLYALERDDFIAAVTGHAPSREAADAVIATRLGSFRTGIAPD